MGIFALAREPAVAPIPIGAYRLLTGVGNRLFTFGPPTLRDGGAGVSYRGSAFWKDRCAVSCHMVNFVAVFAGGHEFIALACDVHLMEGGIKVVPWFLRSYMVAVEYRIVGQPACPAKLAGLPDNETHVGHHIAHAFRVGLCYYGQDPGDQCPVTSNLPFAWLFGVGEPGGKSCQTLSKGNVVKEEFPHFDKFKGLDFFLPVWLVFGQYCSPS